MLGEFSKMGVDGKDEVYFERGGYLFGGIRPSCCRENDRVVDTLLNVMLNPMCLPR